MTQFRASLTIGADGEHPSAMVDCHAEFDRERRMWRAWDDIGNEVHDDWKTRALLRCLALRLGTPMDGDRGTHDPR